jgi:hypothetical protein
MRIIRSFRGPRLDSLWLDAILSVKLRESNLRKRQCLKLNSSLAILIASSLLVAVGLEASDPPALDGVPAPGPAEPDESPVLESVFIGAVAGDLGSRSFRLAVTLGAPDAGSASSTSFRLFGGHLGNALVGDPDHLFSDWFETGDIDSWDGTSP